MFGRANAVQMNDMGMLTKNFGLHGTIKNIVSYFPMGVLRI